ncbi:MAG: sigma-E processing peptidase SpoIIGA [Oscillospiraceae bacterium]|nr:sigma-E processing peptidase SpoIIGA [Oscillospiraceae bacterium]
MVRTVYIDILFVINFIINYLILFAVSHLHTSHIKRWRLLLGGVFSALYGVFAFFPELSFLTGLIAKTVASFLTIFISFGKRSIFRHTLSFFAVSLAFGGFIFAVSLIFPNGTAQIANGIYYIDISLRTLIFSSLICYLLLVLIFRRTASKTVREICDVKIICGERSVSLSALRDTGNSLRAPKTNAPVLICDFPSVENLFCESIRKTLKDNSPVTYPLLLDTLAPFGKFSLLPYKAVGVSFSLLLSYKPERVEVGGEHIPDALIAFSDSPVSDGGAYSAII